MQPYTQQFFSEMSSSALGSARAVAPLLMELTQPGSVVDVGCGTATWLRVFGEHDVHHVLGIDGEYVSSESLEIPAYQFLPHDLKTPLRLERRFDLVLSLEVAEHLPERCAAQFVDSLVRLGPLVAFSAAVPGQGGTHHVNEQWPDYWAQLFDRRGYAVIDSIRPRVWQNQDVEWYYAQNLLLFASAEALTSSPRLRAEQQLKRGPLAIVHPRMYAARMEFAEQLQRAAEELAPIVRPGERFIMVDRDQVRPFIAVGSHAVPFLERDGQYWGPPEDDAAAIEELERQRRAGATRMLFFWPSLWCLHEFPAFREHLRLNYRRIAENQLVVAFDLRTGGHDFD